MKELELPEGLPEGTEEFCRLLDTPDGRTVIVLRNRKDPDPFLWGMSLVDVMHHFANMMEDQFETKDGEPVPKEEILSRLKQGFDAEWNNRTDEVQRFTQS